MPPEVMVVALDEREWLHLLSEYMPGSNQSECTFVKGAIENSETMHEAAERHLKEKLGFEAKNIELLLKFNNQPSLSTSVTYIVLATVDSKLKCLDNNIEGPNPYKRKIAPLPVMANARTWYFKCPRCLAAVDVLIMQRFSKL